MKMTKVKKLVNSSFTVKHQTSLIENIIKFIIFETIFYLVSDNDFVNLESNDIDTGGQRHIFDSYFDTTCDICSIELKSLKRAITHYKKSHQIDEGYIKCCGLKLKHDRLVSDHIRWHQNPEIFK